MTAFYKIPIQYKSIYFQQKDLLLTKYKVIGYSENVRLCSVQYELKKNFWCNVVYNFAKDVTMDE